MYMDWGSWWQIAGIFYTEYSTQLDIIGPIYLNRFYLRPLHSSSHKKLQKLYFFTFILLLIFCFKKLFPPNNFGKHALNEILLLLHNSTKSQSPWDCAARRRLGWFFMVLGKLGNFNPDSCKEFFLILKITPTQAPFFKEQQVEWGLILFCSFLNCLLNLNLCCQINLKKIEIYVFII